MLKKKSVSVRPVTVYISRGKERVSGLGHDVVGWSSKTTTVVFITITQCATQGSDENYVGIVLGNYMMFVVNIVNFFF